MNADARELELVEQDAAARALARRTFDVPLLLEAGAGTGKTTTLIARLVTWSLGPGWERAANELDREESATIARAVLDGIVAITFTEAAAADMGEKLEHAFRGIAANEKVEGCEPTELPCDEVVRVGRARALALALDRPVVQTIHAFCRSLLAAHPFEAGIAPNFQVDADGRVLDAVARDVIERELTARLAGEPDAAIARLVSRRVGPHAIHEALGALASDGWRASDLEFDPYTPDRAAALVDSLARVVRAFLDGPGVKLARIGGNAKNSRAVVEDLSALLECLPQTRPLDLESLDAAATSVRERVSEESRERLRDWAGGKIKVTESKCLGEDERLLPAIAAPVASAVDSFCDMEPLLHDSARHTLADLLARVRAELVARGVETYADLLRDARALLEHHPEVVISLRARVGQLVVDEFQDTDRQQCALVRRIALDEIPGTRKPGLFLVGDPKQSIYGWRNADLAAYEDFAREIVAHGGRCARLSVNYRSTRRILARVESAMTPTMLATRELQPAFQPLVSSRGVPGPAVERVVPWRLDPSTENAFLKTRADDARAIEADWIAADLATQHAAGAAWQHMAILLRSFTALDAYLAALRAHGVPYEVAGDKSYYQRREIVEASLLVRTIADPRDHVALVGLLRSSLVGVPDAALIPLWRHRFHEHATEITGPECASLEAALGAVESAVAELPHDVPGIDRVAEFGACLVLAVHGIARLRESLANAPADVFVEETRTLFLAEARAARLYQGRYRVSNLERFFRRLAEELDEHGADAHSCLRALRLARKEAREAEEARPKDTALDAVQILTIHKSKGLDFKQVYVAGLANGAQPDRVPVCDVVPEDGHTSYAFFGSPSPGYERVRERAGRVAAAERVRTLYVAMTRARDRLVLSGPLPNKTRESLEACTTHADLLARSEPDDMPSRLAAMHAAGQNTIDVDDTRWILPAPPCALPAVAPAADEDTDDDLAAAADELRRASAAAGARMKRPWSSGASTLATADSSERIVRNARGGGDRQEATAIGRAFHRVMEELATGASTALMRERLGGHLARELESPPIPPVLARAHELFDRFAAGSLCEKLRAIGDGVLARELPVLAPPADGDAATCFVSGTIDLVYRDPDTGEVVIVDYKTDAGDPNAARYAAQGRVYQRAVRDALELDRDPRFELWFVAQDRIEVVA